MIIVFKKNNVFGYLYYICIVVYVLNLEIFSNGGDEFYLWVLYRKCFFVGFGMFDVC